MHNKENAFLQTKRRFELRKPAFTMKIRGITKKTKKFKKVDTMYLKKFFKKFCKKVLT